MAAEELTPKEQAAVDAQNQAGNPAGEGEISVEEKRATLNLMADELGLLIVEPGTTDQEQLEYVLGRLTEGTESTVFIVGEGSELTDEEKQELINEYASSLGVVLADFNAEDVDAAVASALAKVESNTGGSGEKALIKIEEIKSILQRTSHNPRASAQLIKALLGVD